MVARAVAMTRGRFFYGWMIVAIGFISEAVLVSLRTYGFGVFFKPMTEELGWTRAMFSSVHSVGFVVEGLISPLVGPIIDKRGARGVMIFGAVVGGAGFAALAFVHGIWEMYLIRGLAITIGLACAGPIVVSVAVSNWFIRSRGKAVAFSLAGVSLGGVAISPVGTFLIATYGWRTAWIILGAAVWVLVILPVALFMKRRPEDVGLLPDGASARLDVGVGGQGTGVGGSKDEGSIAVPGVLSPVGEETWTRGEALRTRTLWLTIVAFGFSAMSGTAVTLHFYPYLTDLGLTEAVAATVYSAHAVSLGLSKILWGFVMDRIHVRYCAMAAFAFLALATVALAMLSRWPTLWLIYLTSIFLGFGLAGHGPVGEVLWANYYGRLSLGAIRTIASPFSVGFGAIGPIFAGWVYDTFQSYEFAFISLAAAYALAAVLFYFARAPKKTPKEGFAYGLKG
ncbi:MAG: MFS transporter [Dehalococcoidia bacterium]|nr:MFS transporter [Dehalococcoidia bacterium]